MLVQVGRPRHAIPPVWKKRTSLGVRALSLSATQVDSTAWRMRPSSENSPPLTSMGNTVERSLRNVGVLEVSNFPGAVPERLARMKPSKSS